MIMMRARSTKHYVVCFNIHRVVGGRVLAWEEPVENVLGGVVECDVSGVLIKVGSEGLVECERA
jgi:hypothetical protein